MGLVLTGLKGNNYSWTSRYGTFVAKKVMFLGIYIYIM